MLSVFIAYYQIFDKCQWVRYRPQVILIIIYNTMSIDHKNICAKSCRWVSDSWVTDSYKL